MVEKLRKITIKCKHCHKVITKMAVRFYGYTPLLDNFDHCLRIVCQHCRVVANYWNVFKEEK